MPVLPVGATCLPSTDPVMHVTLRAPAREAANVPQAVAGALSVPVRPCNVGLLFIVLVRLSPLVPGDTTLYSVLLFFLRRRRKNKEATFGLYYKTDIKNKEDFLELLKGLHPRHQ